MRTEMSGDSCRAESVVKYGFDHGIIAFDVVVNGKRKVRNAHAVMSIAKRVDSRKLRKVVERIVYTAHEVSRTQSPPGA